ncbi:MAG TPA: amidohydrolase family protein [Streptosporangiaceae bacterium]|nr:amidohydrolase family protein [Streptosporangiaceae bacterium]
MGDGGPPAELDAAVGAIALVDHHVHPALAAELSRGEFEELITESDRPVPPGMTRFDSQLGVAVRRWCGPVLGLPGSAPAPAYLDRRRELGAAEVARRLLRAAGLAHLLIDTGYLRDGMLSLAAMAEAAGSGVAEVVRLESIAEQAIVAGDGSAGGFAERFRAALWQRTTSACGVKSIAAYRFGLDLDPRPPAATEVAGAAGGWRRQIDAAGPAGPIRVTDPVLLRLLLWTGVDRGLPVQIHTGFGDPDVDLRRSDPLLLRGFCELTQERAVPLMLLHCYPYHRQAGYLAHAYPHVYLDVGLAINHVGARAAAVVAESLELAPFGKVLFSSDAWGPPELHYLGALLWRRATAAVLGTWVESGDWAVADAIRVAEMIGARNARRVYRLP